MKGVKKLLALTALSVFLIGGCGNENSYSSGDVTGTVENAELSIEASLTEENVQGASSEDSVVKEADTQESDKTESTEQESAIEVTKETNTKESSEQDSSIKREADTSDSDDVKADTKASSQIATSENTEEKSSDSSVEKKETQTAAASENISATEISESGNNPGKENNSKPDYGRIIFTGDSRTVDIFDASREEIWDETHDGIRVFCKDACQSDYMKSAVNAVGYANFDTLISWMGCNDYGNFEPYRGFYEEVLTNGKNLILCTVGPTDNATLANDFDRVNYTNERQIAYNQTMQDWANAHNVKVIQLFDYINLEIANGNLYIDPIDGIHFQPQPTTAIWNKILSSIR